MTSVVLPLDLVICMFVLGLAASVCLFAVLYAILVQVRKSQYLEIERQKRDIKRMDVVDLVSRDYSAQHEDLKDLRHVVGYLFHHIGGLTIKSELPEFMRENKIHRWYSHKQ